MGESKGRVGGGMGVVKIEGPRWCMGKVRETMKVLCYSGDDTPHNPNFIKSSDLPVVTNKNLLTLKNEKRKKGEQM